MEFCGSQWRLIAFLLLLATIQCVRADFLKNETFIDWHAYSEGTVALPYQGKVPIMPILRWAGHSVDGIASMAGMGTPFNCTGCRGVGRLDEDLGDHSSNRQGRSGSPGL
jgi:hypothetical protein